MTLRDGQFTCPVGCGAFFLSPGPPDHELPTSSLPDTAAGAAGAAGGEGIGASGIGAELSSDPTAAAVGDWLTRALRHPSCASLDGIETLEALEEAAEAGRVPPIACIHRLRGGVVAEFVPQHPSSSSSSSTSYSSSSSGWGGGGQTSRGGARRSVGGSGLGGDNNDDNNVAGGLSPVAWFKYAPHGELPPDVKCDPYADLLGVELERLRWGRLACVKLIACENLMDEWEDHHDAPNIDCRKFVVHGVPIALSDYLGNDDHEETPPEQRARRHPMYAAEITASRGATGGGGGDAGGSGSGYIGGSSYLGG